MDKAHRNRDTLGLLVTNHVAALLAYWDKNLICRFANATYKDWFGLTQEEMVDKITIEELLGDAYEHQLPYIKGVLKGKIQTFERIIPGPNGTTHHSIIDFFPDVEDGEVIGFFVHATDITPIKSLENELIVSNNKISEQNKLLLNFANTLSHNLRNYSFGFSGLVEILTTNATESIRSEVFEKLRTLSENFSETIKNLNEVVSVQNMNTVKPEPIRLNDFILKTLGTLNTQILSNNAVILNRVKADLMIEAVPAYIESILINLLSNAIKYKHPTRAPYIEISATPFEHDVILEIKDNGLGINLKKYGKDLFGIFKTFHRHPEAQGIGLYITKYQVEALGGKIEVESEENSGTKFIVHFKRK